MPPDRGRGGELSPLAEKERELYEARVALGVAVSLIPVGRIKAFHERMRKLREDTEHGCRLLRGAG